VARRAKRQSAAARTRQKKRGTSAVRNRKIDVVKQTKTWPCPIVGIGGSAGGFEAATDRQIPELNPNIDFPDLEDVLSENMRDRKARDLEDGECSLRVCPYRTTDKKIDGAVITLVDLEGNKESYAG
jgi:hypothetical protein